MTAPTLAPATTWRDLAACAGQDDLFHRREGDHRHNWWTDAVRICHACPVRRDCIEAELGRRARPVDGSVWGGWVFRNHAIRHHPADRDLLVRHFPKEIHR